MIAPRGGAISREIGLHLQCKIEFPCHSRFTKPTNSDFLSGNYQKQQMKPFAPLMTVAIFCLSESIAQSLPDPSNGLPLVDAAGVVNSVTYDLGDRFLTVEQVTDAILPSPPRKQLPSPVAPSVSPQNSVPSTPYEFISLSVAIYLSNSAPPRSLVSYTPRGGEAVEFWSSADWRLLTGLGSFASDNGKEWGVLMMPEVIDIEKTRRLHERHGETYLPPLIPSFIGTQASYIITKGEATEEQLEPFDALHQLYHNNYADLLASFNAREQARIEREAELKANPPVPPDITVRSRMLTPEEIEATKAQ